MSKRRLEESQADVLQSRHKGKTKQQNSSRGVSSTNVDEMKFVV
jgi:hypothetical protein